MLFSQDAYNIRPNIATSDALELFQGDERASEDHSLAWLRSKRGMACNKTGGFIAEYNLRFFKPNFENFGTFFLTCLEDQYRNILQ